jgi:cellulose synthase/poly-beta-1,6-N-acetylglucosamine synthase-like glycosyltransferase
MAIVLIFTGLLLLGYVALLLYYRMGWKILPLYKIDPVQGAPYTFISIIVPARNEAQHLPALLDSIAAQNFPKHLFELILMDDFSTDETAAIARSYDFVKVISLAQFIAPNSINSYKKKAIEIGMQNSMGELVLTTDADCVVGNNWLRTIAAYYESTQAQLMVMPVMFMNNHQPLGIFQLLDFMSLQGITGASVYKKMHSMCNGANLAYTRSAFVAVDGFKGIDNIASGDDMLLMHKIAKRFPEGIHYIKSEEVIVQTAPMHTLGSFLQQRIRWASKADRYDDKSIFWVLLMVYGLNVLLLLPPILLFFLYDLFLVKTWLCFLLIKIIAEMYYLLPVATFFGQRIILLFFPLAEPFHILYTVVAGWLGKFGSYEWKGRRVK